jgi:hypothetical protein
MSERNDERLQRMSVGARLITVVCDIADKPFVEVVESSFAGYFDELVITIKLRPEASDAGVISLQNQLLQYFNSTDDARPSGFTWLIKFTRDGKSLRSLFPGDAPRTSGEDLEWTE